jgi:hypothetical protein
MLFGRKLSLALIVPPSTELSPPSNRVLALPFGRLGELFHFGGDFLARPFMAPNLRLQMWDFAIGCCLCAGMPTPVAPVASTHASMDEATVDSLQHAVVELESPHVT